MTPDEEAKANRQGSLLFALGGRKGISLRVMRLMENSCRWQLYLEKRSRDGRGTGETDCFLLGFGQFLPSSKRDLLSRQYGFAGDCTVFRLGPSLFRHGLRPRWGCCNSPFYFTITGKIPAMRTVVLVIWTNEKREKKQIFEKLKEKKKVLQSVRKISTNVQARRLKCGEYT